MPINTPHKSDKEHHPLLTGVVLGSIVAVIAGGTIVAVKSCLNEEDENKPSQPATEDTSSISEPQDSSGDFSAGQVPVEFDQPTEMTESGQLCADLTASRANVYDILIQIDELGIAEMTERYKQNIPINRPKYAIGHSLSALERVAEACRLDNTRLGQLLSRAIELGDVNVVSLIKPFIDSTCKLQSSKLRDELRQKRIQECGHLAQPDERGADSLSNEPTLEDCVEQNVSFEGYNPFMQSTAASEEFMDNAYAKADKKCLDEGESSMSACLRQKKLLHPHVERSIDEFEAACPTSTAKELGFDLDKIEELNKQTTINQLMQQNRAFLNFTEPPSEETLEEYNDALVRLDSEYMLNDSAVLKTLGVDDIKQFGFTYVYDVADRLRKFGLKEEAYDLTIWWRSVYVDYTEDGVPHFYSGVRAGAAKAGAATDDYKYTRIGEEDEDK